MRGFGFCSEPLSPASSSIGESALSAALKQYKILFKQLTNDYNQDVFKLNREQDKNW